MRSPYRPTLRTFGSEINLALEQDKPLSLLISVISTQKEEEQDEIPSARSTTSAIQSDWDADF